MGVTTLSIDTGKCLDVEVLTKVCHGCQRIAKKDDALKKLIFVKDTHAKQTTRDHHQRWRRRASKESFPEVKQSDNLVGGYQITRGEYNSLRLCKFSKIFAFKL